MPEYRIERDLAQAVVPSSKEVTRVEIPPASCSHPALYPLRLGWDAP